MSRQRGQRLGWTKETVNQSTNLSDILSRVIFFLEFSHHQCPMFYNRQRCPPHLDLLDSYAEYCVRLPPHKTFHVGFQWKSLATQFTIFILRCSSFAPVRGGKSYSSLRKRAHVCIGSSVYVTSTWFAEQLRFWTVIRRVLLTQFCRTKVQMDHDRIATTMQFHAFLEIYGGKVTGFMHTKRTTSRLTVRDHHNPNLLHHEISHTVCDVAQMFVISSPGWMSRPVDFVERR